MEEYILLADTVVKIIAMVCGSWIITEIIKIWQQKRTS